MDMRYKPQSAVLQAKNIHRTHSKHVYVYIMLHFHLAHLNSFMLLFTVNIVMKQLFLRIWVQTHNAQTIKFSPELHKLDVQQNIQYKKILNTAMVSVRLCLFWPSESHLLSVVSKQ